MSNMERRNTMRRTSLIALLLLLLPTLPALADQADSTIFKQTQSLIKLAQLSPEERRELRERWEQASPEERIRMRQFFQDRLRQLPKPAQEGLRIPFPGLSSRDDERERDDRRGRDKPRDQGGDASADSRYGFGFERRRFEENPPEPAVWPGNRRPRDDNR
jgi:hypothetical protein